MIYLLVLSLLIAVVCLVASGPLLLRTVERLFYRRTEEVQRELDDLFMGDVGARRFTRNIWLLTLGTALAVYLVTGNAILGGLTLLGGGYARRLSLEWLRVRRRTAFEHQLPLALEQLAAVCRAGGSLAAGMELIAQDQPAPMNQELGMIVQQHRMAIPLERAIEASRARLESGLFNLVAAALIVGLEKGGNMPRVLDTLARSFKQIHELEQEFVTASAEARKSAKWMTGMPFLMIGMVALAQPDIIENVTHSLAGWVLVTLTGTIYLGAWLYMRKLLRVDV